MTASINIFSFEGLHGAHQVHNATLAVYLAHEFISSQLPAAKPGESTSPTPLSGPFTAGLENARWPGRCQTVVDPLRDGDGGKCATTWYLDGAHTVESLTACAQWFVSPGVTLPSELTGPVAQTIPSLAFALFH
jgi:folylpolyglutamate synthase